MEARSAGMDKTSADTELHTFTNNGHDGSVYLQVAADNGGDMVHRADVTETDVLLLEESAGSNGEVVPSVHAAEAQRDSGNAHTPGGTSCTDRMKRELNRSKVRLLLIVILMLVLIVAVIIISLVICSAIHEDQDEKFDVSTFTVPRYFNGSFQLPNLVFTEELSNLNSSESQALEGKLDDLFRSSPALGRYFSRADINAFRNGSVIADYKLTFLMPEEEQDELTNFTLSREMVYNVFRQFLYDQDPDESRPMYIDPVSLTVL